MQDWLRKRFWNNDTCEFFEQHAVMSLSMNWVRGKMSTLNNRYFCTWKKDIDMVNEEAMHEVEKEK